MTHSQPHFPGILPPGNTPGGQDCVPPHVLSAGGNPWTAAEADYAIKAWQSGFSASEIAKAMSGRSRCSVVGYMHRHKIAGGRPRRAPWAPSKHAALLALHAQGKTYAEIAAALGMTKEAVANKCRALGLPGIRYRSMVAVQNRASQREQRIAELKRQALTEAAAHPVTLMQLEPQHCRWPVSESNGPRTLFCGCRKVLGAYCATHAIRSMGKPSPSRPDAQKRFALVRINTRKEDFEA